MAAPPAPPAAPAQAQRRLGHPYHLLLCTALALLGAGLVMILSASSVEAYRRYGSAFLFFNRQAIGAGLGVAAMLLLSRVDYRKLRPLARPLLGVTFVLLLVVLVPGVGLTRGGSSRWLALGPFTFQPSEMAKVVLILFSAHVLERKGPWVADLRELAVPLLPVTGVVSLLVIAQPDLGTAVICAAGVVAVMFLAGARVRHLTGMLLGGAAAVAMLVATAGYRRTRWLSFMDPWQDPLNTGYQIIQGQIALGSGGWLGVGLGASRQKWSYVPNAHTDFIFAILGEEMGLAGTIAVLGLFVFLVYLGVRIARKAPDRFGTLLAGGIAGWIGVQAFINMGAVTGLLPITGVPLPFISYGGSSLVFTMAAIGILLSVARRGRS